jgi:hypothetical protein
MQVVLIRKWRFPDGYWLDNGGNFALPKTVCMNAQKTVHFGYVQMVSTTEFHCISIYLGVYGEMLGYLLKGMSSAKAIAVPERKKGMSRRFPIIVAPPGSAPRCPSTLKCCPLEPVVTNEVIVI